MVYVLNIKGQPIMPCKEAKARKLLKNNTEKKQFIDRKEMGNFYTKLKI